MTEYRIIEHPSRYLSKFQCQHYIRLLPGALGDIVGYWSDIEDLSSDSVEQAKMLIAIQVRHENLQRAAKIVHPYP